MTVSQLDYWFPFLVFFYGLVMVAVLSTPALVRLGEQKIAPEQWRRFQAHKGLGYICFFVGALWSLQHLLIQ